MHAKVGINNKRFWWILDKAIINRVSVRKKIVRKFNNIFLVKNLLILNFSYIKKRQNPLQIPNMLLKNGLRKLEVKIKPLIWKENNINEVKNSNEIWIIFNFLNLRNIKGIYISRLALQDAGLIEWIPKKLCKRNKLKKIVLGFVK